MRWYGVNGAVDLSDGSHSLAYALHGGSLQDRDLYVMINAYWQGLTFTVQEGPASAWSRVIDTSLVSPNDIVAPGGEVRLTSLDCTVNPRSIVVLLRD